MASALTDNGKDLLKKLKIKTGSCKRLHKEIGTYVQEAKKQQDKIAAMKAKGADSHDVKKQEEVLTESQDMIPDVEKRLEAALHDLTAHMQAIEDEEETIKSLEDWKAAQEVVKVAQDYFAAK
eukprot:TRINITY_DN3032_c0_g1_i2.p1 TRINITY_DN3032_c0_g1~~TRINITY_DN3032_c0_g1_i2.p1  ORF type:complete len:123 (-),score=20.26 TRINITY_DN3032_c0_g1_i2:641-1009(-)